MRTSHPGAVVFQESVRIERNQPAFTLVVPAWAMATRVLPIELIGRPASHCGVANAGSLIA
jgi:hypothetical protein